MYNLLLISAAILLSLTENTRAPKHRISEEESIRNVQHEPSMENIATFLGFLKGAAHYAPSSERFFRLKTVALEIEHLPTRLGEFIRNGRGGFQPIPEDYMFREYESARQVVLFYYLPSLTTPESVSVLASFLADEEDIPEGPAYPYPFPQGNCDLAINGLRKIGLRGFPNTGRTERPDVNHMESLEMWRSWWGKVKSGKIAFSFEGEGVEYRFKPDGSWVEGPLGTTSLKDRATHSASGALRTAKRPGDGKDTTGNVIAEITERQNHLPMIATLLLVLSGITVYAFKLRKSAT